MADVTSTVRAIVTVVDKATAPLRGIESQFKAFGAGLGGSARKLKDLGNAAPLYKLGGAFRGVGTAARSVLGDITKIAAPIAGLIGAGGIGGIAVALNRFAGEGERLQNLSAATGETVEHLQELDHWADISGVSTESLHKAIARTNKAAGEAAHGNKTAAATFKALGISVKDTKGHVRTFGEIAPQLADHFARMKSATERARLGNKLFGKGWAEIVPLLAQGGDALAKATEEARKHGLLNDDDAAASDKLGDAQRNLTLAIQGVGMAIAKQLAPTLTPLIEKLTDWIDKNRGFITAEVLKRIKQLGDAFTWLSDTLGGVGRAVAVIGGIFGAIIFAPLIAALATLAAAFVGVASAAGLFTLAALPWLLLIGAIIAAVVLLYRNADMVAEAWDAALGLVGAAWSGLVGVVSATWDAIKAMGAQMAADMGAQWQSIVEVVTGLVTGLGTTVSAAWASMWDAIKATASTIAGDVRGQFDSLLRFFDDLVGAALRAFARIAQGWQTIKSAFGFGGDGSAAAAGLAAAAGSAPARTGLAAAGAAGAPGTAGRVDVVISAPNQTPGTRIATKTSGKNLQSRSNVGYSMPQLAPAGAQ